MLHISACYRCRYTSRVSLIERKIYIIRAVNFLCKSVRKIRSWRLTFIQIPSIEQISILFHFSDVTWFLYKRTRFPKLSSRNFVSKITNDDDRNSTAYDKIANIPRDTPDNRIRDKFAHENKNNQAPSVSCIVRQLSIKLPFKLESCAFVSRWTTPHPRCRERRIFDCSLETYCVSQSKPYWQVSQLFECRQRFRLGACRRQRRRRDIVNACSPEKLNTWSAC